MSDRVLEGITGDFCLVYLDGIIVYSNNVEDHKRHIKEVLDRLRKNYLKIKLFKCKFARSIIEYLSHVIENGTLTTNPAKVGVVADAKITTTVKKVQSFMGLVSYYRKFIRKSCLIK